MPQIQSPQLFFSQQLQRGLVGPPPQPWWPPQAGVPVAAAQPAPIMAHTQKIPLPAAAPVQPLYHTFPVAVQAHPVQAQHVLVRAFAQPIVPQALPAPAQPVFFPQRLVWQHPGQPGGLVPPAQAPQAPRRSPLQVQQNAQPMSWETEAPKNFGQSLRHKYVEAPQLVQAKEKAPEEDTRQEEGEQQPQTPAKVAKMHTMQTPAKMAGAAQEASPQPLLENKVSPVAGEIHWDVGKLPTIPEDWPFVEPRRGPGRRGFPPGGRRR